jgi:hypothetical protein
MKVVINNCFGGFGLSEKALARYNELCMLDASRITDKEITHYYDIERNDPLLVQVVEELGKESYGDYSVLKIVDIPDGISWYIQEYDGLESIHETHRVWD